MKTLKILLLNLQYATGLDGSLRDYFLGGYRYVYTPVAARQKIYDDLNTLLDQERPDVCCLMEVKNDFYTPALFPEYPHYDVAIKYRREGLLAALPILRNNCNAVLMKDKWEIKKHFLRHGTKALLYELIREGVHIFTFHFALGAAVRAQQCAEIASMFNQIPVNESVILCGDFNIFGGRAELDLLMENSKLSFGSSQVVPTFPAFRPTKELDLYLLRGQVKPVEYRVLSEIRISDHLPVILTVQL